MSIRRNLEKPLDVRSISQTSNFKLRTSNFKTKSQTSNSKPKSQISHLNLQTSNLKISNPKALGVGGMSRRR